MTKYVAGFLFDDCMDYCLFVRKNKPAWQAGRLNAIGGKIETYYVRDDWTEWETPQAAMTREFKEETGVGIEGWRPLAVLSGFDWEVHFFYQVAEFSTLASARTMESEAIELHKAFYFHEMLPNLQWLIPMAKSLHSGADRAISFSITEAYENEHFPNRLQKGTDRGE